MRDTQCPENATVSCDCVLQEATCHDHKSMVRTLSSRHQPSKTGGSAGLATPDWTTADEIQRKVRVMNIPQIISREPAQLDIMSTKFSELSA